MATRRRGGEGRNDQVVRILGIIRLLHDSGGQELRQLAQYFRVTERTIRRDLDALREAGVAVADEPGEGSRKRWVLDRSRDEALSRLYSVGDYLALKVASEEASFVRANESLLGTLVELMERVERALGPSGRAQLRRLEEAITSWDKFALRRTPPVQLLTLVEAIGERRVCEVTYRAPSSGNQSRTYSVLPLKLLVHHGTVYLHAWQERVRAVMALNINRLEKLSVTDRQLPVPQEYNPRQLEDSAFGIFIGERTERYCLHFDSLAAPYIEERQWHPSERVERRPDGSLIIEFDCTPSYEVTNWVASWREHVRVLAPEGLKAELAAYGDWLARTYRERIEASA